MTAAAFPAGLVTELASGHLPWRELRAFPDQAPGDRGAGDEAVARLDAALGRCLDGQRVEEERRLPPEFVETARRSGFLRLQIDRDDGGLGLSDYNSLRVVTAAMARSTAAGFALAVHNGIGLPALLPAVPDGPLRALILKRLAEGAVSSWADTEPSGAANILPTTRAEPRPGGGYRLTGQKTFITNATIADELIVSASVPGTDGSPPDACLFLVDTSSRGFRLHSAQEVVGLKGLPLGVLELSGVDVPPERVVSGPGVHWRDTRLLEPASSRGRTYLVSGAALAIARRCVDFQRDFAGRRAINGRPLSAYPVIKKLTARSLADLYAVDTVARWGLLGADALISRHRDRYATKNIVTAACWRVVERTVSLMAAEGAETAASKQGRGAPPLPAEQLLRDARVLRITGGVDFVVDMRSGRALADHLAARSPRSAADGAALGERRLSAANVRHLDDVAAHARRLADAIAGVSRRADHDSDPIGDQAPMIATGRVAGELLTMALVLARCADAPTRTAEREQQFAEIYCADARERLATAWRDFPTGAEPTPHTEVSDWWHDTRRENGEIECAARNTETLPGSGTP